MKLQNFLEYINNIDNLKFIDFNTNELKYLLSKGNLIINDYNKICYVNFKEVRKTSNNEFLILSDNIICNTIQTLVKKTDEITKPAYDWFSNIMENSNKIDDNWYYNNKILGQIDKSNKIFFIDSEFYNKIKNNYQLTYIEIHYLTSKVLQEVLGMKDYTTDW